MNRTPHLLKVATLTLLLLSPSCNDVATTNILNKSEALSVSTLTDSTQALAFSSNAGSGYSLINIAIGDGFYASNICEGNSVLGLTGTAPCNACYTNLYSSAFRGAGSTRLTSPEEGTLYGGTDFPSNYHAVPIIKQDDEGACTPDLPSSTCNYRTRIGAIPTSVHNSFLPCGVTQTTIAARITDCADKNGPAWTEWDGLTRGTGAEGVWKLVTVASNNGTAPYNEVWLDMKTGHLWSSRTAAPVPTSPPLSPYTDLPAPWCAAAGNDNNCDLASAHPCAATNQNYCVHNQTSYCTEVLYPTPRPSPTPVLAGTSFTGDLFNYTSSVYSGAKGGMGLYSTPSVPWRLPTLSEYDIADVNGIRYVMADMGAHAELTDYEWTATLDSFSSNRKKAFTFSSMKGTVISQDRTTTSVYARCIAPLNYSAANYANADNSTLTPGFYSVPITVTAVTATSAASLPITLDTATPIGAGKMNSTCSNLKFTGADGVTLLSYYLESGCNSASTLFWVRVPAFTSSSTVNFVYGGLTAGVAASFSGTFPSSYTATGTTGVLSTATYDSFSVPTGTSLTTANVTAMHITAARIVIDGTINLDTRGFPGSTTGVTGGSGAGAGLSSTGYGGGAGHGGAGGCALTGGGGSCFAAGGATYGSNSTTLDSDANLLGSGGSSGEDFGGGNGGGALVLIGSYITLGSSAALSANGGDGTTTSPSNKSQGGGSGGTLYLSADKQLTLAGTLSAKGGRPGLVGGGGGGGRIKILSPGSLTDTSVKDVTGAITTSGGASISNVSARGSNGAVYSGTATPNVTYSVGAETETFLTP